MSRNGVSERGHVANPVGGKEDLAVPHAVVEHQQSKARHVAGGEGHGVFGVHAAGRVDLLLLGEGRSPACRWARRDRLERLIDVFVGELLEGVPAALKSQLL